MNEYNANVAKFDGMLDPLTSEYDQLKADMDSGVVEESSENVDKLNELGGKINILSEVINR